MKKSLWTIRSRPALRRRPERIAERLRGILANDFAARLDTERYTQYLRPHHIPQAQTVPPTARRQNRVAAPQSVPTPEPASVAPTPEVPAPAASLFGSAAAVPIARRPLGQRRAGRRTDTTGMSDLFTQGNLFAQPAEAAEATDAPAAIAAPVSRIKSAALYRHDASALQERSWFCSKGRSRRLGGLTRQGCTFHPEELGRYRAERYIRCRIPTSCSTGSKCQNGSIGPAAKTQRMLRELHGSVGRSEQEGECRLHLNDPGGRGGAGARTFRRGRKQLSDILRRPYRSTLTRSNTSIRRPKRWPPRSTSSDGWVFLYGVTRIAFPARADRRAGRSHFLQSDGQGV